MGAGIAAAAHVGVATVSAPAARGLVEVEAHSQFYKNILSANLAE